MYAVVFPGQGSQYAGMGAGFEESELAQDYFKKAKKILGFDIQDVMVNGSEKDLKQTKVTQPAVFLHSLIKYELNKDKIKIEAFTGHSLGELTAIVASGSLGFEDGLTLVKERAFAMQDACQKAESTMAAVLGLDDKSIKEILTSFGKEVVPANFNCPGQVVISGSKRGIADASKRLKEIGAKRVLELKVGGAFHSPFMKPASKRLNQAIDASEFAIPNKPIYQNFDAKPSRDPYMIASNLKRQLVSPVLWTQIVKNMVADEFTQFAEIGGKGNVLAGLIRKIDRAVEVKVI